MEHIQLGHGDEEIKWPFNSGSATNSYIYWSLVSFRIVSAGSSVYVILSSCHFLEQTNAFNLSEILDQVCSGYLTINPLPLYPPLRIFFQHVCWSQVSSYPCAFFFFFFLELYNDDMNSIAEGGFRVGL
ncbi:hypothetical protein HS088_TW08G00134 [Tripterygium wilfordii]|uniref:Uncharacterized protein n=1 Tax=Tripterygium wilfordii TaxID=458696 RepID=A0A7J7DB21_TRIWF|nr:hypothetical protein HS088_TW08G00134 [Tripterygium wilfordii]